MQRYGRTGAGTQRWRCVNCGRSSIRRRKDQQHRRYLCSFVRWLTGTKELCAVAKEVGVSRAQLSRRFEQCWREPAPTPPLVAETLRILILDGVYLSGRVNAVLVARSRTHVCSWDFHERECFLAWDQFLSRIPPPLVVVCCSKTVSALRSDTSHIRIDKRMECY